VAAQTPVQDVSGSNLE